MESKNKGRRKLIKLNQIEAYKLASESLQKMYETEVGKKFVHHLIYAFTAEKNTYVLFSKSSLFDCLTKSELQSVFCIDRPVNDEFINSKLAEFKVANEEDKCKITEEVNNRVLELLNDNPIPRLAIRSELTDKIIGSEELQALTDFIKDQIKSGNKVITGMIKYAKHKDDPEDKPKQYYTRRAKKELDPRKTLGGDDELRRKLESVIK